MAKFLGVLSTRYQHPSDDLLIEFTDLDLLANFLFHETKNLFYEFQRKSEVITEQEINLCNNLIKILEIQDKAHLIHTKTLEMEKELQNIGMCIKYMEKILDCLHTLPINYVACKCTSNSERSVALERLLKFSEEYMNIEEQIDRVKNEENWVCLTKPYDLTRNLLLFLDLYTQILENLERKSDKLTDQLHEVEGLFINAHKRFNGACYHKPRHDVTSSFC